MTFYLWVRTSGWEKREEDWINLVHQINKLMNEKYMIISLGAEKALDKMQQHFMIKAYNK